jgi:hypothetical protein
MSITTGIALSLHLGLANDYNGFHPYIRYENQDFIAGVYYNSEDSIGVFAGVNTQLTNRISVDLGLVSGYSGEKLMPMLRFVDDKTGIFITPGVEVNDGDLDNVGLVIGIQF